MEDNSFVILFKENEILKNQLIIAESYADARDTFEFEYLNRPYQVISMISYADLKQKLDDLKNVFDDAKLVENKKGEMIEIRPHHPQYDDVESYLTKDQIKYSLVGMLELFRSRPESFLISSKVDVEWSDE